MRTTSAVDESPCPACDGRRMRRLFTKGGRQFWRCSTCALERQLPLPDLEQLRAYYERNYDVDGRLGAMFDSEGMLDLRAAHRLREIRPHLASGRWLDVGCSEGGFVATARAAGIDAAGIELSQKAVDRGRSLGRPVTRASIAEHVPDQLYDSLTAFDVLEHVHDPRSFLSAARRLLKPTGTLALTVPNQRSLSRRLMRRHWYFYIPDAHLLYFDAKTLAMLLEREGFGVEHVASTWKPITYRYALTQLKVLNAWLDTALRPLAALIPTRLADAPIPLPLGEILVIARRRRSVTPKGSLGRAVQNGTHKERPLLQRS